MEVIGMGTSGVVQLVWQCGRRAASCVCTMSKEASPSSAYKALLADLKRRILEAQVRAGLAVNRELVLLYWSIGREILVRQEREGWGAKVIDSLARDLNQSFP